MIICKICNPDNHLANGYCSEHSTSGMGYDAKHKKLNDILKIGDKVIVNGYMPKSFEPIKDGDVGEIVGYCYVNDDKTIMCYYGLNGGVKTRTYSVKFDKYPVSITFCENQILLFNPLNIY